MFNRKLKEENRRLRKRIEAMDIEFEREARLNKIVDKLCKVKEGLNECR